MWCGQLDCENVADEMLLLLKKKVLLLLLMKSDMSLATGAVRSIVETASNEMYKPLLLMRSDVMLASDAN